MADRSVPILNIPWIEGVLAGDNSRPKFGLGDGIKVVDNKQTDDDDRPNEDEHAVGKYLN